MRTNGSGVTEVAEFNIDKEKYDANYVHIFQKDKCQCSDCVSKRLPTDARPSTIDTDIVTPSVS